jgi:hypothetical protein
MIKQFFNTTTYLLLLLTFSCNSGDTYNLLVEFDKVDGLYEKAEVKINGFKVGSVKKMDLVNNKIITSLTIDSKTKISNEAVFTIKSSDLLGTKHIEIDNIDSSDKFLSDGDKIQGFYDGDIIATPISLDSLVLKIAKPILDSLGYDVTPKQKNKTRTNE